MAMTPRDKALAVVLPAVTVLIGYAAGVLPAHRAKVAAAEKALASTEAQIPSQAELASRLAKLAATTKEAEAEAKQVGDLRPQPDAATADLAAAKRELADARKALDPAPHRAALAKAEAEHAAAAKRSAAEHAAELKRLAEEHKADLARLWAGAGRPAAARLERIDQLNKLLARAGLTVLDATDDVKAPPPLPTVLAGVLPVAAEADGKAPPQLRSVRVRGGYAAVAAALDAFARGEVWAVPAGLTMGDAADDDGRREWVLLVWV